MYNKESLNEKKLEKDFNSKTSTSHQEVENEDDIIVDEIDFDISSIDLDIEIPDIDLGELDEIVGSGVKTKVSFFTYLKNAIKDLGFRNIFHDKSELIVIALAGTLILWMTMMNFSYGRVVDVYRAMFILSPMVYLGIVLFSFYNSKSKGVFQLEMTCKYNLYQLSALRMFIFSIGSLLINTMVIVIMAYHHKDINAIRMIIISITGLFLFSTVFLYSLIKLKSMFAKVGAIALWIIVNLLLSSVENKYYVDFLMNAPIYIHIGISVICCILYIKRLNDLRNYRIKKRREIIC
ncbi:hypothetical protein [Clostridium sp. B9]|uniref:hypothetical protein n=1 Tax=Clostridium sp. B9 TaxID=3423224 RepID=UPI003D2E9FE0